MSPNPIAVPTSRPEILLATVIHLMTHYASTGCPRLAVCISRHLQCLCTHPDVDAVIRDVCAGVHGAWARAADCATATTVQ